MSRTVVIHDPLTRKKPQVVETLAPPTPVKGKVYIVLNWIEGVPGAHVAGAFAFPSVPTALVQAVSGNKTYKIGDPPARSGAELWDIVTSEVVESCP